MNAKRLSPAPGQITALRFQKRNPERVNLFIDGRFAMGVPAIEAARLRVGQVLSAEEIQRLQESDAQQRAYERALKFLSYRPRSIAEVRQYLREHQVEESHGSAVIEKLLNLGYLDDQKFAQWWVENRKEFNPRGSHVIRRELLHKGVAEDIINEAIEQLGCAMDTEEEIEALARKRARRLLHEDRRTFRRKLGSFLLRRGFAYETVAPIVDRLWQEIQTIQDKGDEE